MSDSDTLKWVIPAISIGYAVVDDAAGKLRFFGEGVEIIYRNGGWISITDTSDGKEYGSLVDALQGESWRISD